MSSISRATIRDTIRFRGDYQNVRKFPNADLNKEIQTKFDKFWQLIEKEHQGWWDKQGDVSTVLNQAYIALPADCWVLKAVDRMDGTEPNEMAKVGVAARNRFGTSASQPLAYRRSSRGLELYPTPNGVYTLRITYAPYAPTLDEGTGRDWYTGWEDYVIESVLLELDTREGKPLGDRIAKIAAYEKQVKDGVDNTNAQEPDYLVLRERLPTDPYDDGIL